jgi:hypothetical protein
LGRKGNIPFDETVHKKRFGVYTPTDTRIDGTEFFHVVMLKQQ